MNLSVPRDYSLIAPVYDHVFNKFLSEGHRRIGTLLQTRKNVKDLKVLEVGVGSGLTLNYLPSSINFTGVDINPKMLALAEDKAKKMKRRKISLSIMDAEKLTFKTNTFDMVLGASVITAVQNPHEAMKEMIRVTKKGGHIAIVANVRNGKSYRSRIVRRFDPLTKRFLGFRTDMDASYFKKYKEIKLVENKEVNNVFGFPLSSFLLFEKL